MAKAPNLVIVESPAKAKTIEGILGGDFQVLPSYGHIRDLKKTDLGVDIQKGFTPHYIISKDKQKIVSDLQKAAEKAEIVWLASDEDREGEAIAWHLYEVLDRKGKPTKRIAFHEITPTAIKNAIENPRDIDLNLVDAQQARRVLDRIVGFELSPILWRRIKPSLSAGRVQSVALRLICEREEQIKEFTPERSYKVVAEVLGMEKAQSFEAVAEIHLETPEEAKKFLEENSFGDLKVISLEGKPARRSPSPPFTTSSLQQEASRKLGFSVGRTMSLAQKLYENGYITYMRTDSTNLSALALNSSASVIKKTWGDKYHQRRVFHTKTKGAQEAHEAIRPTDMSRETIKGDKTLAKLYELIRMRTLASQMSDASFEKTIVKIKNSHTRGIFIAQGEVMLFDGFLKAYNDRPIETQNRGEERQLPPLKEGETLQTLRYIAGERYSYPPARYTEASLVKKLEELGIGRPSTYAPTIQTLFQREYIKTGNSSGVERTYNDLVLDFNEGEKNSVVEKKRKEKTGSDKGKLLPTDIGLVVNTFLVEHFPKIVDYNFTAEVEEQFDQIAAGEKPWTDLMKQFYALFEPMVASAMEDRDDNSRGERLLGIDPKSGRQVIARIGRYGPLVQLGNSDDGFEEKPQFATLSPEQSIMTITLQEALDLMKLPRRLGTYEEKEIKTNIGRFGAYIQHGSSTFVSIPQGDDPFSITLEKAIELILEKREKEIRSVIKTFEEDPTISIREGRWGPYIKQGKNNFRLDKSLKEKASELTFEEVSKIITSQSKISSRKTSGEVKKTSSKAKSTDNKKTSKASDKTKTKKAKAVKSTK